MDIAPLERMRDFCREQRERWEEAEECVGVAIRALQAAHNGNGARVVPPTLKPTAKNAERILGVNYMGRAIAVLEKESGPVAMSDLWRKVLTNSSDLKDGQKDNFYATVARNASEDGTKRLLKTRVGSRVQFSLVKAG